MVGIENQSQKVYDKFITSFLVFKVYLTQHNSSQNEDLWTQTTFTNDIAFSSFFILDLEENKLF